MVITKSDYTKIIYEAHTLESLLEQIFTNYTILFVGFGLKDIHLDMNLTHLKSTWKGNIVGSYAIMPNIEQLQYDHYLSEYNVHLLGYEHINNDNHNNLHIMLTKIFPNVSDVLVKEEVVNAKEDLSSLPLFPKAFPLEGKTRIIYTCRSNIEHDKFICPSINLPDNISKSLTLPTHIPIDEVETYGLLFEWYGPVVLGKTENQVHSCTYCANSVQLNLINETTDSNKLDEILLDNIIIIGENRCSNYISWYSCYDLPWRHLVEKTNIVNNLFPDDKNSKNAHFSLKAVFKSFFGNSVNKNVLISSGDKSKAVITYMKNPYASDKWIISLVGFSRSGQYLLLEWLRNVHSQDVLQKIIQMRENKKYDDFIQIFIYGTPLEDDSRGNICRCWAMETISDNTDQFGPVPFFINRTIKHITKTKYGESISDLSLVGKISLDDGWIKDLIKTLPDSLKELMEEEKKNGNIGFHVTLFEFLHSNGVSHHGILDTINERNKGSDIIFHLKKYFESIPPLQLNIRQTSITEGSLQLLVDVKFKQGEEIKIYDSENLNALDYIYKCCFDVTDIIKKTFKMKTGNKPIGAGMVTPLHITIMRFNPAVSNAQCEAAKEWAEKYKSQIWGSSSDVSIILTKAKKAPYSEIESIRIK